MILQQVRRRRHVRFGVMMVFHIPLKIGHGQSNVSVRIETKGNTNRTNNSTCRTMNVKGMFQTGRRCCGSCGHHQKNAEPPPEQDREREVGTLMTTTTTTLDRSVT